MRKLTILFIISLLCSFSISAQTEKKSAYKKFVERFDKATTKVEEELPEKIEKGMEILTDNLEDFEKDIHAEPKKQSKFAKIFNYIADIDIDIANTVQVNKKNVIEIGNTQRAFPNKILTSIEFVGGT